jgi:hypothetical protein
MLLYDVYLSMLLPSINTMNLCDLIYKPCPSQLFMLSLLDNPWGLKNLKMYVSMPFHQLGIEENSLVRKRSVAKLYPACVP